MYTFNLRQSDQKPRDQQHETVHWETGQRAEQKSSQQREAQHFQPSPRVRHKAPEVRAEHDACEGDRIDEALLDVADL